MTTAYSIDIQALHNENIIEHIRFRDHVTLEWIEFVPVYAFDEDWLAIDQKLIAGDFYVPEADLKLNCLCDSLFAVCFSLERIEIGRFCRPQLH